MLNLSLHDPSRDCMVNRYWKKDHETGEFAAFPAHEAASGWAWKHQKPIAIPDIEREQRFPGCVPAWLDRGIRSLTVLPMSTPAQHFGALGLGKKVPEVLLGEDVEFLSYVALMGAVALEKEEAQRAFEEQQSLLAISRELNSSLELDKLLPLILASVRNIAHYEHAFLSLIDEDGKRLHIYGDAFGHDVVAPLERSLSARAIQTRKVAFFTRDDVSASKDPTARVIKAMGIQAVCSVPLIAGNRVWGTLNTNSTVSDAFSRLTVEYLRQFANQIAAALQNAHAYREIAKLNDRVTQERTLS